MFDLASIQVREATKLTSVDYLDKETTKSTFLILDGQRIPIVLDIRGENFNRAQSVVVNGNSLNYHVINNTRLFASVPEELHGQRITQIVVLTDKESFTNTALYFYELAGLKSVSGPKKLVFQFIKLLMTTPNSDVFEKHLGGGLQKFAGSVSDNPHAALALVAQAIMRVGDQIRTSQRNSRLPNNEKLQVVEILSIDFSKGDRTSIEAGIRVTTKSRESLPVSLALGVRDVLEGLVAK
jgi:hypothetical protein